VRLLTEDRMTRGITVQLDFFLKGFHDIIPLPIITFLDFNELELLIAGLPEIGMKIVMSNALFSFTLIRY
jgi:E3 ubiquitin-protein ligase HUWE1